MTPSKDEIRLMVSQRKKLLSDADKFSQSIAVFNILSVQEWFRSAKKILFYYSLPSELPTHYQIETLGKTKNIFLPRINGDSLDIIPLSKNLLSNPHFHVLEPTGEPIDDTDVQVAIIPAVAFDLSGNRLGRGRGYYDRFLSGSNILKVGVGFDCQLFASIPAEPHDVKMDFIVTPSKFLSFKNI